MADDLFRVFKSVRKLVREKTEDLFGNVSPLERTLRDVVDEDSCAVSNSLLRHIAVTTNDAYAYSTVAQVVWQGISSEFWQRIYKCLCLLEYMILLGPERCRQDCADAQMTIRSLTQYRFHDGRREQGGGVRQKAENILKLINDVEYWKTMKQQAIQDTEKYSGGIENEPYISPIAHMNIHTRATNPFFTGPQAVPPLTFGVRDNGGNPFSQPATLGRGLSESNGYFGRPAPKMTPCRPGGYDGSNVVGGFGLYDPGDDFATDDPFAGTSAPTQPASSLDPFAGSVTAPPVVSQAQPPSAPVAPPPSLLDDDLFETSELKQNSTSAVRPAEAAPNDKPQHSLLPDLLE